MSSPSLAQAGSRPARAGPAATVDALGGIGAYVWMLSGWIFLEFAKPVSQTFKIPMLVSMALFVAWLRATPKRWPPQLVSTLGFVALMAMHGPFARNNFHAFWTTYYMAVTAMVVCPLVQFVDSVAKVRLVVNVLILAFLYIGAWAALHAGFGPLGAASGQDENYVGQAMTVGISLAFFSIFAARSWALKLGYAVAAGVCTMATVIGFSRGGFLGLCAVGLYCWLRSPGKLLAAALVGLLALVVVWAAPQGYWREMGTITASSNEDANLRVELWKIAWREFLDHPIVGVAPGNFRWYAGDYQSAEQHRWVGRSLAGAYVTHSLYFELLAETGLIGVFLVGTIMVSDFRDKRRIARLSREHGHLLPALRDAQQLARGLTGGMIGFLVCTIFLSNLYNSYLWILAGLTAGLRASAEALVARLSGADGPAEANGAGVRTEVRPGVESCR